MDTKEFFTEYGEANRYTIKEVIGKGSYGVVCSAVDIKTGEKVAIKKINNVFDHVSDATRILREIKLLRLLRHPGQCCVLKSWLVRCTCPFRGFLLDWQCSIKSSSADIVEIKHIMLPPSPCQFKDIYVVFELMETDLHQVGCTFLFNRKSLACMQHYICICTCTKRLCKALNCCVCTCRSSRQMMT